MKKIIISLISALFIYSVNAIAQPSLTAANINPVNGDSYTLVTSVYPASPGASGAGVTWNFSTLPNVSSAAFSFINPVSSIYGNTNFTSAAVSALKTPDTCYYFNPGPASMLYMGIQVNATDYYSYSDPEVMLNYPFNYTNTFTDAFTGPGSQVGFSFTKSGSTTVTADGWGILITPGGTFNNVLRVHQTETGNYLLGFTTIPFNQDTYYWYLPGIHYPVLTISSGNTNAANANTCYYLLATQPVVAATATSASICAGSGTTITASGASTYSWTPGNLSGASVNVAPVSTTTYTVTGTDNNGMTGTSTVTITVNPLPVINANSSANAVCEGNSVTLTGSGNATSYNWSGGITDGVAFIPVSTATYTVTGVGSGGCISSATTSVTVNPLPVVIPNASANAVCAGSFVTLSASGTALVYSWSGSVSNGVPFIPTATATYTITGQNANCSAAATISVTVNPLPSVMATTTDSVFCINDAGVSFLVLPSGGMWSGAGVSGNSFTPSVAGAGVHPAVYSYTDGNGCSNSAIINMIVYALPSVTANSTASAVCAGSAVTLSGGGASSYSWTGGVTDGVPLTPTATNTYTVTGTNLNSCTNTASTTVTVNPQPTITAQAGNQTVVAGTNVMYYVSSQAGATYQWQTNVGFGWQNLSNFGQYNGVNNDTLTISSVTLSNTNQPFQCIVTLGSCSSTSAIAYLYVNSSVGISEITSQQLSVYPNPVSSNITVTVNPVLVGSIYTITDLLGNTVLSGKLQNETSEVNLDEVAAGMYMLKLDADAVRTIKLIKQ